jgi:hypothetical protein
MKARTEQERLEMEALTRQQFDSLSQNLRESSKNALSTTEAAILGGIADMEKSITSRCQSLGKIFDRKYLASILLSGGILLATTLACWGLITLYQNRISDMRRELADLTRDKNTLETQYSEIWMTFKGLKPHHADGKDYLLTPVGWTIQSAGQMPDKRDAWIIVRK